MAQPLRPLRPGPDTYPSDPTTIQAAVARHTRQVTSGIADISTYLARQNDDHTHRQVTGPLLATSGASGTIVHHGWTIAQWGDPTQPEMLFSATKSLVATVAGLAADRHLLDVHQPVAATVDHPAFTSAAAKPITWHHLLQQTSGWHGELWGKPTWADAQSHRNGPHPTPPGSRWAYNDVRVNLLCLALTARIGRSLPAVLREQLLDPLGASTTWEWHGYRDATITVDGQPVPVVSGGAHWGGGAWMSANDLALLGELYLCRGQWAGRRLLSADWIDKSWRPCPHNPDYGYLWWLNDQRRVQPAAPPTGRCARGNLGRHLLWIDPHRDLVIAAHWTERIGQLLAAVSQAAAAP